jgi:pimeloyl-ACP methyl ester carboxylesterase
MHIYHLRNLGQIHSPPRHFPGGHRRLPGYLFPPLDGRGLTVRRFAIVFSMSHDLPVREGELDFNYPAAGKPLKTFYKVTGDLTSSSVPLIILHGGPGVGLVAYNILSDLTRAYGIPIVQYDQAGCSRSTHLSEKASAGIEF